MADPSRQSAASSGSHYYHAPPFAQHFSAQIGSRVVNLPGGNATSRPDAAAETRDDPMSAGPAGDDSVGGSSAGDGVVVPMMLLTGHGDGDESGGSGTSSRRVPDDPESGYATAQLGELDVDFENDSFGHSQFTSFELRSSTGRLGTAVHDHLYVGSIKDASNAEDCEALGILGYLCVAGEISSALPPHVARADLASGRCTFEHIALTDDDCTRIRDHIATVFGFIDRNAAEGRPVVIYCQQGKSRSVSFAVAYMMRERGLTADAALAALRQRYKRAEPNIAFLIQLKGLEEELIAEGHARREAGTSLSPTAPPPPPLQPPATVTGARGASREMDARAFFGSVGSAAAAAAGR